MAVCLQGFVSPHWLIILCREALVGIRSHAADSRSRKPRLAKVATAFPLFMEVMVLFVVAMPLFVSCHGSLSIKSCNFAVILIYRN